MERPKTLVHKPLVERVGLSVVARSVFCVRDLGLDAGSGSAAVPVLPDLVEVREWTRRLGGARRELDDAQRIDLIRAIEELKCAAEGAQAVLTADVDESMRRRAAHAGEPPARQGRGIASQVALARRESPHKGQRHLGLAKILQAEMPCTRRALREGRLSEWRATLLARETACLSLKDRMKVDQQLAGDAERLEQLGDREIVEAARSLANRLDPAAVVERRRRAEADRHTTLRPAPDVMTWLGALLPVKDGVAVHKALLDEAGRRKAVGDKRSRGAIMADTLVERVLAPHLAGNGGTAEIPLMINVVVPDDVLLGDSAEGGWVDGYGEVPGDLLREWIAAHAQDGVKDWVRRLYAKPESGELVAMDKRGRRLDGSLGDYLKLRDRHCRTAYCGAPVRHVDHSEEHASGGRSSACNAQGLCEFCNHAKQAVGWTARPRPGPRHTIETTTPTGHRYLSTAPPTRERSGITMEIYPLHIRVA